MCVVMIQVATGPLRRLGALCLVGVVMAGCQTVGAGHEIDPECASRQAGSKLLARAAGFGAGLTGIPFAGKISGTAVSYATQPDCQLTRPVAHATARPGRQARAPATQPQPQQPAFRIEPAAPPGR